MTPTQPFIGRLDYSRRDVAVVGGGISGLLAAYFLQKKGFRVELYEAQSRLGGLIASPADTWGRAELAAHSLRASLPLLDLFDDLGLERVHARTTRKYIWVEGQGLRRFPLAWTQLPALLRRVLARRARPAAASTVADWARWHLGSAALDRLIYPLCQGIYATPPDILDLRLAFPHLLPAPGRTLAGHLLKQRRTSATERRQLQKRLAGRSGIIAPAEGMEALVHALGQTLETHGGCIRLNTAVDAEALRRLHKHANVVLALPAPTTAELVASVGGYSTLAPWLRQIRYVPLVVASLVLERASHHPPEGLGVLAAAGSRRHSLGILFTSSQFAGRAFDESSVATYSLLFGGWGGEAILTTSDEQLRQYVVEDAQRLLGLRGEPLHLRLTRWPAALPLYDGALVQTLGQLRAGAAECPPGLVLTGNYLGTISIRGLVEQWSWAEIHKAP